MKNLKEEIIIRENTKPIILFLLICGVAVLAPFYIHAQWLTGPLVNCLLTVAIFIIGIRGALVLCLIPSLMALSGGLIPAVLAPVVPFIMISNVILVLSVETAFNYFKDSERGYLVGLAIGSILKFIFLFLSVNVISRLIIKQELAIKVAQMMSWPQLATAITGGMIAFILLKKIKKI